MSWLQTPVVVTSLPHVVATETGGCDVTGVLLSKQGYRVSRLCFPICLHISDLVGVAITRWTCWEVRSERRDSDVHICHQPVPVNTGASPSKCLKTSFEIHIFSSTTEQISHSYFIVYSIISWKMYIHKKSITGTVVHQSPPHHNISRDRNIFKFLILTSRSVRGHKQLPIQWIGALFALA